MQLRHGNREPLHSLVAEVDLNARLGALTLGVDDDPVAELRVQHVLANAESANITYRCTR